MSPRVLFGKFVVIALIASAVFYRSAIQSQLKVLNSYATSLLKPCSQPIPYAIGAIDERFNISTDSSLKAAKNAERIWEDAYHANLFEHKTSAPLAVNFVYDERQQLTQQSQKTSQIIGTTEAGYNALKTTYEKLLDSYNSELAAYNTEVEAVNARGGATPQEYERLRQKAKELNQMVVEVNNLANKLNTLARQLNLKVDEFNATVGKFNETLAVKPEAGLYSPADSIISIYEFENERELTITLAHEFGHALGINHIETDSALMNAQISKKTHLTSDDIAALKEVCSKPVSSTLNIRLYQIIKPLLDYVGFSYEPEN